MGGLGIDASNLEYSFHNNDFNFLNWRYSDDGFECHRDQNYLITCKHRWTHILNNLDYCKTQYASGGKATFNAIIAAESITIAVLLLYIYRFDIQTFEQSIRITEDFNLLLISNLVEFS